jgi:DNA-3-methyladenine glycosylase I
MSIITGSDGVARCDWVGTDPAMIAYHDTEWGRPTGDEIRLFEKLSLEGFQAGLSWRTVLHKRERFRAVYDGFDPDVIAGYSEHDIDVRASDAALIRQRAKHAAVVRNARAYRTLRDGGGTLAALVYQSHNPTRPRPGSTAEIPAQTAASVLLAKTLKQAGFVFVGPVTMYALMQACGVVNDHVTACATSV